MTQLFNFGSEIYKQNFTYDEVVAAITLADQPCAQDLNCEDICEIVKVMVFAWENMNNPNTLDNVEEWAYISEYVRKNAEDWVETFKEEKHLEE